MSKLLKPRSYLKSIYRAVELDRMRNEERRKELTRQLELKTLT